MTDDQRTLSRISEQAACIEIRLWRAGFEEIRRELEALEQASVDAHPEAAAPIKQVIRAAMLSAAQTSDLDFDAVRQLFEGMAAIGYFDAYQEVRAHVSFAFYCHGRGQRHEGMRRLLHLEQRISDALRDVPPSEKWRRNQLRCQLRTLAEAKQRLERCGRDAANGGQPG